MPDHFRPPTAGSAPTPDPFGALGPVSGRDRATGRFAPGNRAALVTGERSRQFWEAADAERRAKRAALLRQRGFASEADAPPALVAVADGCAQAVILRDATFNRVIELGGPTTTHDRRRDVLKVWENASDRALRHLQAVGLETQERDAMSIEQYIERVNASPTPQDGDRVTTETIPDREVTPDDADH